MIVHHWVSNGDGTAAEFTVHDVDKDIIRENIVEAVIVSESLIRLSYDALILNSCVVLGEQSCETEISVQNLETFAFCLDLVVQPYLPIACHSCYLDACWTLQ